MRQDVLQQRVLNNATYLWMQFAERCDNSVVNPSGKERIVWRAQLASRCIDFGFSGEKTVGEAVV